MGFIEIKNLYKSYKPKAKPLVYAVRDVSLSIDRGEILGLVGESGCGKSTLGKLILKLEQPTQGGVVFDGEDITGCSFNGMRARRRRMQMVFQGSAQTFNPLYTLRQILREPLDNYHDERDSEKEKWMADMLHKVGLDETYLTRYPHEMSGGQRQRGGIARALILNPDFVVCDEAVSSVDYAIKNKILKLLVSLKNELSLTYLFISHDIAAVNSICDRIAVMYLGNIVEILPNINSGALHPYTQALLAATLPANPRERKADLVMFRENDDMSIPKRGCVFQNRCLYTKPLCAESRPALEQKTNGRFAACHYCTLGAD
ncbi:MAG: ABC transporter ATP-binding protein [Treponema sp.]|jgi:peptide/nickel transport system ATP-binding protein/oligopeptide transport system ATP-binding protein|nr:ABC transporter ATP-binding protein [Treponema sp.]